MKATRKHHLTQASSIVALLASLLLAVLPALARDTDIYATNAKQNSYILMDSSGSMAWAVYEHTIDYGAMYDYLYEKSGIYDPRGSMYYGNHADRNRIYLIKGDPQVAITTSGGKTISFTGDPSNTSNTWYFDTKIDTYTLIDENGELTSDGAGSRLSVDSTEGTVLFDGTSLPVGMSIKLHDKVAMYDGSIIDNGFGGIMNAPGCYFSGYTGIDTTTPYTSNQIAANGNDNIYFFVTGNWINMQQVLRLRYNYDPPGAAGNGSLVWSYESFPLINASSWTVSQKDLDYPAGSGNYANNQAESTIFTITEPNAKKIQIHFSSFDVEGNGNASTFPYDYVKIVDNNNTTIVQYDNDNNPTNGSGWSPTIIGDTVHIKFKSDGSVRGTGFTIDKIRVITQTGEAGEDTYQMQSRLDTAKDAMRYVVDNYSSTINWGFAKFNNGVGATIPYLITPTDSESTQQTKMTNAINAVSANGGTPLMEALQDVWNNGFYNRRDILDDTPCRKNYIISMTDGFPSADDDNNRIAGVTFGDWDGDGWTQDPSQYSNPNPDYYDDVANWIYKYSWMNKTLVSDPANSYENVITHHISFGANHPLLKDAAEESGGQYIAAYNKQQLASAFYSLTLMMSESISFTAPVVSVDAVNKIQSGDDLYMGLFMPEDSTYWTGNLKKFKMGDGSTSRPKFFMIYDAANEEAINSSGAFFDNTAAFWGDDLDANDNNQSSVAEITEDGAGEVLLEDVQQFFANTTYWDRPIYTWKNGAMVKFTRDNITAAELGVSDDTTRDKLINFVHGYTYEADAATSAPVAVREWVLGAIIHSRPVVIDYFDTDDPKLSLKKRLVAVGSNDGMLHIFDDTNGREVFAFIPPDILPSLKNVQAQLTYDTVDGLITLHREDKNPKYLIFGERRGGSYFWNLNISKENPLEWTVAWNYTNSEIVQSWSEVKVAKIPVGVASNGKKSYKNVAIFTGGYDPEEDNFPEPFTDKNNNGSMDTGEWVAATQDLNNNGVYNKYNPAMNEKGRGIFVVDIDNPASTTSVTLPDASVRQILPFSVTYGATSVTTGAQQRLPSMKFSFPASPSVVTGTDKYTYKDGAANVTEYKENVLLSLYAIDVYANLFKSQFGFEAENAGTEASPSWRVRAADWTVNKLFSANPGSSSGSGRMGAGVDSTDQGRKAFYPPAISWGGSKGYFEAGNYIYPGVTFNTKNTMASLFFGTGDRENPKYTMIRNRFYAIYDDSSVTAQLSSGTPTPVQITSAPYQENDLLNLTCDELGKNSTINSCYMGTMGGLCTAANAATYMKDYLRTLLKDDAVYPISSTASGLEEGAAHENDAKGWYIVLDKQGDPLTCSHVTYPTSIAASTISAHDNHTGEQILSQAILYYGTLYFTSYQAAINDPCNPQGNGYSYSLNYLDGSAVYDLTLPSNNNILDITDRYKKFTGIYGIPSGFTIILRGGRAAAMASMGGALVGPGPDPLKPFEIATPGLGLELFYWRDNNSQQ